MLKKLPLNNRTKVHLFHIDDGVSCQPFNLGNKVANYMGWTQKTRLQVMSQGKAQVLEEHIGEGALHSPTVEFPSFAICGGADGTLPGSCPT